LTSSTIRINPPHRPSAPISCASGAVFGDGGLEDGFATTRAVGTFEGPSGGGYAAIFAHGTRVPLVVSVTGNVQNVQSRAKVLIGTNAGAATIDAAIAHLIGVLEAMGYVTGWRPDCGQPRRREHGRVASA
jgi:hypothetical protein